MPEEPACLFFDDDRDVQKFISQLAATPYEVRGPNTPVILAGVALIRVWHLNNQPILVGGEHWTYSLAEETVFEQGRVSKYRVLMLQGDEKLIAMLARFYKTSAVAQADPHLLKVMCTCK